MKLRNGEGIRVFALIGVTAFAICISAQTPSPTPSPAPAGGPTSIFRTYDGTILRKGEFTFSAAYRAADVRTEKLASTLMAREMPYRIVLPVGYSDPQNSTKRFPVVYLLHGLTGHYNNWTDKTKIAEISASQNLIIVTPEGDDGWYSDSATKPNDKYESYLVKELIPEIDKKFRTIADREHRSIAGLSMGGYGAIKFGLKYPDTFSLAGSFSGAIGAASITEKEIPGAIGRSIDAIFGLGGSATRKANDPFDLIRSATAERIKSFPFLYVDCGTEDFLFPNNRDFVALLLEKNVPHEYRQLPGGHNWTYWGAQVQEFLELANVRFSARD
jgi:putative tributyrin esterase